MSDTNTAQASLEFYKEQCTHGRHIELQRSAVASMFLVAAGVLLSVMGALKFAPQSAPLGCLVIALGVFAKGFVKLYSVKFDETSKRRNIYRVQVQNALNIPDAGVPNSAGSLREYWHRTFDAICIAGVAALVIVFIVAWANITVCGFSAPSIWTSIAACQQHDPLRAPG